MDGVDCGVTQYNNYIIFKNSFFHLLGQLNLYTQYTNEQYDLFKYTPSFALIFGFFAILPNALGLFIWNLLNVGLPILGFSQLLGLNKKTKPILLLLLMPEMLTSVLNSQSNGLILGLMLLALAAIQRENTLKAVVLICITGFIKLFGIALFAVFLLYPNQLKKAISIAHDREAIVAYCLDLNPENKTKMIEILNSVLNLLNDQSDPDSDSDNDNSIDSILRAYQMSDMSDTPYTTPIGLRVMRSISSGRGDAYISTEEEEEEEETQSNI